MSKTIIQKIVFKNANAGKLYSMYLDSKQHTAITGGRSAKITAKKGSKYSANDNGHSGKFFSL